MTCEECGATSLHWICRACVDGLKTERDMAKAERETFHGEREELRGQVEALKSKIDMPVHQALDQIRDRLDVMTLVLRSLTHESKSAELVGVRQDRNRLKGLLDKAQGRIRALGGQEVKAHG